MSNADPTGTGAKPTVTIMEAADAFSAMLNPPQEGTQDGSEEQAGAEAQGAEGAESVEETGAELEAAGEEGSDSESDAGEEAGEQDENAEGGEEQDEDQAPVPTFTVRVDGKDEKIELPELIAGYSRTADYTRKTQALANERKSFEPEVQAVRAERAEYGQLLPKLRAALEAGIGPEPDWAALRAEDPAKAAATWQEREERKAKIAAVREQERKNAERASRDHEAQVERVAVEQHNLLMKALPQWSDQKVADREADMIVKSLQAVGFSGEELKIFDHRAVQIARKAALYDQIVAQRKGVKPKLLKAPTVKPGAPRRTTTETERQKADRNRLNKTGSVRDAGKVFENLFK